MTAHDRYMLLLTAARDHASQGDYSIAQDYAWNAVVLVERAVDDG